MSVCMFSVTENFFWQSRIQSFKISELEASALRSLTGEMEVEIEELLRLTILLLGQLLMFMSCMKLQEVGGRDVEGDLINESSGPRLLCCDPTS